MNLNFVMAVLWFVVGMALLVVTYTLGDAVLPFRVRFLPISPGWLALVLCAYNLARWWSRRRLRRDPLAAALEARRRMHRDREGAPKTPDPTFNFTDNPPSSDPPLSEPEA